MQDFAIVIDRGESDWWIATVGEVPGALSQGKTPREAYEKPLDPMSELIAARHERSLKNHSCICTMEPFLLTP
jgi:predicted RNase H-like HicB family nuclease